MEWDGRKSLPGEFFAVAEQVYEKDPYWLPESVGMISARFSHQNPYFQYGKVWLKVVPGKARLAGFVHPLNVIDGSRCAFFGFWETIKDTEENKVLFKEFETWVKQQGIDTIYGPINFTTFDLYRTRMDQFDKGAFPSEPYNPSYYPELLSELGYLPGIEYLSTSGTNLSKMLKHMGDPSFNREKAVAAGVELHDLTPEYFRENIDAFYKLTDIIFRDNFGYTKIPYDMFSAHVVQPLSKKFCTKTSTVLTHPKDGIIGCFFGVPDYSPLLNGANQRALRQEEIEYEKHFSLIKNPTLLAKTAGILPEYQGLRLYSLMTYELIRRGHEAGYRKLIYALMRAGNLANPLANKTTIDANRCDHHYSLYSKEI